MIQTEPYSAAHKAPIFCLLALGAVGFAVPPSRLVEYAGLLWLLSILCIGMPHGAADWFIFKKLFQPQKIGPKLGFISAYCVLAGLYLWLWKLSPESAVILFLLLTAWHWGSGDSLGLRPNPLCWITHSLARGSIVVFAPLAFHLDETRSFLEKFPGIHDGDFGYINNQNVFFIWILFSAITCLLMWGYAIRKKISVIGMGRLSIAELFLILIIYYYFPPLLSVALYFLSIHGLRHMLYLLKELPSKQPNLSGIFRLHIASLGCTLPAVAVMIVFWQLYPEKFLTIESSTAQYLVLIAGLTLPHAILIVYWDILKLGRSN
ncbi:MAG TPA: hypothetical protein DCX06_09950 [Opitutae bacterium]|nr:hypothetical protein [Opitutae bacterium]